MISKSVSIKIVEVRSKRPHKHITHWHTFIFRKQLSLASSQHPPIVSSCKWHEQEPQVLMLLVWTILFNSLTSLFDWQWQSQLCLCKVGKLTLDPQLKLASSSPSWGQVKPRITPDFHLLQIRHSRGALDAHKAESFWVCCYGLVRWRHWSCWLCHWVAWGWGLSCKLLVFWN